MRRSVIALLLSASLLAACDNQRVHALYTGSADQAVTVQANDTVLVTHIDAEEQDTAFIGQKHSYRLAPGKHVMVVEYAALFQIDADRHEKLTSAPIKVTFEAKPGRTYLFRHPEQKTLDEAKNFAKSPTLELVALPDNTVIDATFERSLPTRFLPTVRFENTESYGFASDQKGLMAPSATTSPVTPAADGEKTVETLKSLWLQATPAQRESFREWLEKQ